MQSQTPPRTSIDDLLKITYFTRSELEHLTKHYNELVHTNDKIDRSRFRDLLADTFGVDDSLIMDRVFRCFDLDADNYIGYDEFMKGMNVFLKGKHEDRLKFCFRVYDLNGDRYISKEEMYLMLKNSLVRGVLLLAGEVEDDDGVKDLVDLVLKKLDEDRDGRVSESDWASAIGKENLLMEAFGQCMPNNRLIEQFLNPTVEEIATKPVSKAAMVAAMISGISHHKTVSME
ncbi:EF-hand calcium-binding domain-containing protein 1 [Nowakowskiella sp. JEL0407]|nr:EF-hand calcium-binding domain-containing protein 1 [Nowakowskiella sp. JEL0407]